jgi:hypothetical protein
MNIRRLEYTPHTYAIFRSDYDFQSMAQNVERSFSQSWLRRVVVVV